MRPSKKNCDNCKHFNYMSRFCEHPYMKDFVGLHEKDAYGFKRLRVSRSFGCVLHEKGKMSFKGYR